MEERIGENMSGAFSSQIVRGKSRAEEAGKDTVENDTGLPRADVSVCLYV